VCSSDLTAARAGAGDDAVCHHQRNTISEKQYLSDAATLDLEIELTDADGISTMILTPCIVQEQLIY
jgi:hypothetical protein